MPPDDDHARLDKWLWTARFYKTRGLAAAAVDGGKVELNGEKAKRSKPVRRGDQIRIRLGPYEHRVTVLAIAAQRGPAAVAAGLFQEDPSGRETRERIQEQHRLAARLGGGAEQGRPTKRDRREIQKVRGKR